ncbi:MAG: hypothetical protein HXX16_09945 [Bacteroidales bacterium]|nr:hypothetical protein [Bacteroidales bacterium]
MAINRFPIFVFGLFLFFVPGLLILGIELFSELGQSNPFIIAMIIFWGGIPSLVGIIAYLIADKKVKRKIITGLGGLTFYILLLPIIGGVNSVKEKIYLVKHHVELEQIAIDVLNSKITVDNANQILKKENLIVSISCVPEEKKHVLFLISGMIDNCFGFSYSLTDEKPSDNCCGDFTSWKKIRDKWFVWTTT